MHKESRRSHTAEGAAAIRAAAARDPAVRNPDRLAEQLISRRYRLLARVPPLRAAARRALERRLPGLYLFVTARTMQFDAVLLKELERGLEQIVVLGAGADSRAYRFADRLRDVRVFELDHPATGAWKQARIRALFGSPASHVRYVPVEFHSQTLDEAFDRAGISGAARTLFIWEGVAMYLSAEAVDATLATVARFVPGSSLVFDYLYRDALENPTRYPEALKYLAYMRDHGEPLVFGLDPEKVSAYLAQRGLAVESNADTEELVRLHLQRATEMRSALRVLGFSNVVHARVTG